MDTSVPMSEVDRLRAALERIKQTYQRSSDSWRPGNQNPNEYGRGWHDGYITFGATASLIADEALDPVGYAEHEKDMQAASGTDREWFERTGNCGHCGNLASDCVCTEADPCECGPHEPRTWPIECWKCKGTGQIDPVGAFTIGGSK